MRVKKDILLHSFDFGKENVVALNTSNLKLIE